jgi:hypothetical protein
MRNKIIGIVCLFFALMALSKTEAQQRLSVSEKVATVHNKFITSFHFDNSKMASIDVIFTEFYNSQDKIRDNIQKPPMASGLTQGFARQDYQNIRKQNENILDERDNRLRQTLTNEQYTKWKEEIEPTLSFSRRH